MNDKASLLFWFEGYLFRNALPELMWDNKIPLIHDIFWWKRTFYSLGAAYIFISVLYLVVFNFQVGNIFFILLIIAILVMAIVVGIFFIIWAWVFERRHGGQEARFYIFDIGAGLVLSNISGVYNVGWSYLLQQRTHSVSWQMVSRVKIYERKQVIYLKRKLPFRPVILYCTSDNFNAAVALITKYVDPEKIHYIGDHASA